DTDFKLTRGTQGGLCPTHWHTKSKSQIPKQTNTPGRYPDRGFFCAIMTGEGIKNGVEVKISSQQQEPMNDLAFLSFQRG
nr:hypothetical protein [Pseudomonadota bacterium]